MIYDADSGDLWLDRDDSGAKAAVLLAHLEAGLTLTGQDFTRATSVPFP